MILDNREYLFPPDNEAKKIFSCDLCGEDIYEGEMYFKINGFKYCERCVEKKIAEPYDIEGYISDLNYDDI